MNGSTSRCRSTARVAAAAARLVDGEHDFTSFAASSAHAGEGDAEAKNDDARSTVRTMTRTIFSSRLVWRPRTSLLIYEVRGSGFLHHMVRNIVGTMYEVGRGKLAPRDLLRILEAHDRTQAGPTAPARGLCLVKVEY